MKLLRRDRTGRASRRWPEGCRRDAVQRASAVTAIAGSVQEYAVDQPFVVRGSDEQRGQMAHATLTIAAATLAAATHHRRHGFIALVLLVIIIAGVAYYFWHRRNARREREHESR
jgi:hypothetical protein